MPSGSNIRRSRLSGHGIIGRDRELAVLAQRLQSAERGEGGLVLVHGEPGIGKSRLLSEFRSLALSRAWRVLDGRAYDAVGMPPYVPFAEAMADHLGEVTDDVWGARLVAAAPAFASLIPALRDRLADLPSLPSYGPEADRYRVFDAIASFLLAVSDSGEWRGLLLCLDDLHWADKSTLDLLLHLARKIQRKPLLVCGAYRTEDVAASGALFETLADLARERLDERMVLTGLSMEETGLLVGRLSGVLPAPAVSAAIHRQTLGNPFFIEEVVRQVSAEGRDLAEAGLAAAGWGVSEGVRQVIGRRLRRLGPAALRVLQAGAILGPGFDVPDLRAVSGLDASTATEALEEATAAGMLHEDGDAYSFGHPLIRQVVAEGLSLARGKELHARAADAIERRYASRLDEHLEVLALHFAAGDSEEAVAKAVDYATRAGDRARTLLAFEEAAKSYELALESARRGAARSLGPVEERAHAGLGVIYLRLSRFFEAQRELRKALETVGPERTEQRVELLTDLSEAHANVGETHDALAWAQEALAAAQESGDAGLVGIALTALGRAEVGTGDTAAGLEHMRAGWPQGGRPPLPSWSTWYSHHLWGVGRYEEAVARGTELVAPEHAPSHLVLALPQLGLALAAVGRYGEAEERFAEARRIGQEHASRSLPRAISMSSGYRLDLYDFDGAQSLAEEARDLARKGWGEVQGFLAATVAQTAVDLLFNLVRRRRVGEAEALLTAEMESMLSGSSGVHARLIPLRLAQACAEMSLAKGQWDEAVSLAEEVMERIRAGLGRAKYDTLAVQTRGQALMGLGRKRAALVDLHTAVELAKSLNDPALILRAAAALLDAEPDAATAAEAQLAIQRILAGLTNADLRRVFLASGAAQCVDGLTRSAPQRPQRPSYTAGLSERQLEVLQLIAAGKSNREIADTLVLSERTVERHVADVYAKLGVRNRSEATAFAIGNLPPG